MKHILLLLLISVLCVGIVFAGQKDRKEGAVVDQQTVFGQPTNNLQSGWVSLPQDLQLSTSTYKSIEYASDGTIWIGGGASAAPITDYCWKSTDNGVTWTKYIIDTPAGATSIQITNVTAKDANIAVVGTYTGEILRTSNGGTTWTQVYSYNAGAGFFDGIQFIGGDKVIAIGDADANGVCIVQSTDAGATWTRVPTASLPDTAKTVDGWISYASYGQSIAWSGQNIWTTWYWGSGHYPLVVKSTDGGATWSEYKPDLHDLANNYYFRSIVMKDDLNGFGVSRRYGGTTTDFDNWAVLTTDGGNTWSTPFNLEPSALHRNQKVYSGRYIPGTTNGIAAVGFSATTGSKSWFSTDGGTTWTAPYTPGTTNLTQVAFKSPTEGFTVGFKNVRQFTSSFPVTFQVNMKVKIKEGLFNKATDVVTVRGSFNDWGNSTNNPDTLKPLAAPNDSTYSKTILMSTGAGIDYKFWASPGTLAYENLSGNRSAPVPDGGALLPLVYFSNDSVVNLPWNVTFQVNMKTKLLEGVFKKDSAVTIRGSMNDWGNSTNNPDTLKRQTAPNDSIWAITKTLYESDTVFYKFWAKGLDYESLFGKPNRKWGVGSGAQTVPLVWFDDDSVVNTPINATFNWRVNMRTFYALGWFNPTKDSLAVQGDFTGWSDNNIDIDLLNPEVYQRAYPFSGVSGDMKFYKFRIRFDSVTAVGRWGSDYAGNISGYSYEHPVERGDGNNIYVVTSDPLQEPPQMFFSGINPQGVLQANDSVNVTLRVNMGPAKAHTDPFVSGDTVLVVFQDALWRGSQRVSQGSFTSPLKMALEPGGGDSIFTVTFKVKGKTHYNLQYTYRYRHIGGTSVDQGGGLGVQNPYITRFIRTATPGTWPASYTMPLDIWQKSAPLPGETVQFTTDIPVSGEVGKPLVYSLDQNYPNPFNPSTQIKYSIPEAAKVTLKVFNVLGQEVMTLVNDVKPAGSYVTLFEARTLASGVYFYRLEAGKFSQVKKMLLLK